MAVFHSRLVIMISHDIFLTALPKAGAVLELPSVFYRAAVGVRCHVLPSVYFFLTALPKAGAVLELPSVFFFSFVCVGLTNTRDT